MELKDYLSRWQTYLNNEVNNERLQLYQDIVSSQYEGALAKMYTRLPSFHPFDWSAISPAYYQSYPPVSFDLNEITFNFPEFLRSKFYPAHLVELAEFELAEFQAFTSKEVIIKTLNVQLNPTNHFLHLSFDLPAMIRDATIQEKTHILCICRHPQGLLRFTELDQAAIQLIISLEEGQLREDNLGKVEKEIFQKLLSQGVIIDKL